MNRTIILYRIEAYYFSYPFFILSLSIAFSRCFPFAKSDTFFAFFRRCDFFYAFLFFALCADFLRFTLLSCENRQRKPQVLYPTGCTILHGRISVPNFPSLKF